MDHKYYGLVELTFSAIVALGIGGWQYWSVSRSIARDKAERAQSPEDAGHAVGQHRLDDD